MQPREYSKGSGTDNPGYERSFVVNVNWNANDRNWNVDTWNRNEWNEDKRVFSPETFPLQPLVNQRLFCFQFPSSTLLPVFQLIAISLRAMRIFYYLVHVLPTLPEEGI